MRLFTVTGPQPAYGAAPGDTVRLDERDSRVQLNVAAGVLTPAPTPKKPKE